VLRILSFNICLAKNNNSNERKPFMRINVCYFTEIYLHDDLFIRKKQLETKNRNKQKETKSEIRCSETISNHHEN
jgi:hypothetical protein